VTDETSLKDEKIAPGRESTYVVDSFYNKQKKYGIKICRSADLY